MPRKVVLWPSLRSGVAPNFLTVRRYELEVGRMFTDVEDMSQFLVEAVALCIVGGLIGAGVGMGAAVLFKRAYGWNTIVGMDSIVLAFSATVGILFGVWPANRAAGLDPIEALRYE